MPGERRLNAHELAILGIAAGSRTAWFERPSFDPQPAWTVLVRHGLLESTEQSERVRGERRTFWRIYRITEAGRQALASQDPSHV